MYPYTCSPKSRMWRRGPFRGFYHYPGFYTFRQEGAIHHPLASRPAANISSSDSAYQIRLAVPGLTKDQIRIEHRDDRLIVSAAAEPGSAQPKFTRREFDYSSFTRSFRLHAQVDASAMTATLEQGLLTITMPRIKPESRQISIL